MSMHRVKRWPRAHGVDGHGSHGGRPAALGHGDRGPHGAAERPLVRRLRRRVRGPLSRARRGRHLHRARPCEAAQQLPGALRPQRRRACRGPHLHLLARPHGRRAHQQLARPRRDAGHAHRAVPRLHARPHDVRHPLLDGTHRLAHQPAWRADHRLALRRGQHAHHDPHGHGGPGSHPGDGRLRALPPLRRCAARTTVPRTCPGRAIRSASTSCTSPRTARSGPTGPATGATRCWARSATPCASRPPSRATRAGWPSTCSSSRSPHPTAA